MPHRNIGSFWAVSELAPVEGYNLRNLHFMPVLNYKFDSARFNYVYILILTKANSTGVTDAVKFLASSCGRL